MPSISNPNEVKAQIAAYDALISNINEPVGRMIAALRVSGPGENTVIVFTSDHGLAIGSHGLLGMQSLYEHKIGVPLVTAGPGIPQNQSFDAQTHLRDRFPTFFGLVGAPVPPTVEGRSPVPDLRGMARENYPEVYADWHISSSRAPKMARAGIHAELPIERMVRTERWQRIYHTHLQRYQLFDLANDPHELKDLSGTAEFQGIKTELQHQLRDCLDPRTAPYDNTWS